MRLETKMTLGSLVMALVCGAAGIYGVQTLGEALEHTTGSAWKSAEGGMQGAIEIEAQALAVKNVLNGVDVETNWADLEARRQTADDALNQLDDAGQLPSAKLSELRERRDNYETALSAVLAAHEASVQSGRALDEQTAAFVALAKELEAKVDTAVEQFEDTPDKAITWDTGLQVNWDAADGGMHVRIGLLSKLYALSQLRAGHDREECLTEMADALAFQEDGMHHLEESGLFDVPVDPENPEGETLEEMYKKVFRENTRLMDLYLQDLFAFQNASKDYEKVASGFLNFLSEVADESAASVDTIAATVAPTRRKAWIVIGVSLLLCVGACIFNAIVLAKTLRRPLSMTVQTLKKIAAGNLTERVEVTATGEVGELVESVNQITDSYHTTMKQIVDSSETLSHASEVMSTTAEQLAEAAESASQRSSGVASAAEEMATTMGNVSSTTEDVSSNVSEVATCIKEMTSSIMSVASSAEHSAGIAKRAADSADESNQKVTALGEAAREISEVVNVIQDIAEQTNLLALNATIESARAGESGKGFAVVAQEVKQLAQQTTEATEDIRHRIEAVLDTTEQAVESIRGVGEVISEVNGAAQSIAAAVEQQSSSAGNVTVTIDNIATAATSVADSVSKSATASRDITLNMTGVNSEAQKTSSGASSAKEASSELQGLASQLQQLVGSFTV